MRMLRNSTRILCGAFVSSLALTAQTFTTLYHFGSQDCGGAGCAAGVIVGPLGELYGTTTNGGKWNSGTVYELLPPASSGAAWTEVVIHSFNGQDGERPSAGLAMAPSGALYGVTPTSTGWAGTAFALDPPTDGGSHWPETILYRFTDIPSALVFGSGRSLYGNMDYTVFSLAPPIAPGSVWTQTALYSFSGGGTAPVGTLAVGGDGTLFGVTTYGGRITSICKGGCGIVFSLTPPAVSGGPWTMRVLYGFNNQKPGDGYHPQAGVVLGPTGVLYGTTASGGGDCDCGTVFSLAPPNVPGTPMTETILHAFNLSDGFAPSSSLVLGLNGALYGVSGYGGASNLGALFELTPPASPGGSWTETILHSFMGQTDGSYPNGLTLGPDGTLYGTTAFGDLSTNGTVFALTP
jgi:uncharacterized repeat protein (TIGR03803 family)